MSAVYPSRIILAFELVKDYQSADSVYCRDVITERRVQPPADLQLAFDCTQILCRLVAYFELSFMIVWTRLFENIILKLFEIL